MDSRIGSTSPMPMNAITAANAVIHTCLGCPRTASSRRGSALMWWSSAKLSQCAKKLLTDANNRCACGGGHARCGIGHGRRDRRHARHGADARTAGMTAATSLAEAAIAVVTMETAIAEAIAVWGRRGRGAG